MKPEPKLVPKNAANGTASLRSVLTISGIAQARSKGVIWGKYGQYLAKENRIKAEAFAGNLAPILLKLGTRLSLFKANGMPKVSAFSHALNAEKIPTPNGGKWHPTSVRRVLVRLGGVFQEELSQVHLDAKRQSILNAPSRLAMMLPADHPVLKKAEAKRDQILQEMGK